MNKLEIYKKLANDYYGLNAELIKYTDKSEIENTPDFICLINKLQASKSNLDNIKKELGFLSCSFNDIDNDHFDIVNSKIVCTNIEEIDKFATDIINSNNSLIDNENVYNYELGLYIKHLCYYGLVEKNTCSSTETIDCKEEHIEVQPDSTSFANIHNMYGDEWNLK